MAYDISWVVPRLRAPTALWTCASSITVAVVGLFSKFIVEFMNKTTVYNAGGLRAALTRPEGVPLITVANHHSCFDDPGLWGVVETGVLVRAWRMRWSLAAHDICFTRALHSWLFALGRCVPVLRGQGVYQPAIDFCGERLARGDWVHVFPEGRVNVSRAPIRLKWGVGRLVALSALAGAPPIVLPLWHEGMPRVLPNEEPYRLRKGQRLYLSVGEPVPMDDLLLRLRKCHATEEETRLAVTERIQRELLRLRDETHRLIAATVPSETDTGLLAVGDGDGETRPKETEETLCNGRAGDTTKET